MIRCSTLPLRWLLLAGLLTGAGWSIAAENESDPTRELRLQFIKDRFADLTLRATSKPSANSSSPTSTARTARDSSRGELVAQAEPLLRYTNPVGGLVSDASLFVWKQDGLPVAACGLSLRYTDKGPTYWIEMTNLSGGPWECLSVNKATPIWAPLSAGAARTAFEKADAPNDKPASRLVAMRQLARRFEASIYKEDRTATALRLMPQPLDRYRSAAAGVIDGALFAFVEANDPELLLLIEAVEVADGNAKTGSAAGKKLEWQFTPARITSRELKLLCDQKDVFAAPNYWSGRRTINDTYVEFVGGPWEPPQAGSKLPAETADKKSLSGKKAIEKQPATESKTAP